ncbi:unnamed protein product [Chrysodeixis includens]|uniref:PDZ domain-containing protein n=1 Tax=Chrysodeixis includens TaxID=689277 RepID=A0A9N8KYD2_CHRIL|nr:unnamed protein product [Chrysodeixis includens]
MHHGEVSYTGTPSSSANGRGYGDPTEAGSSVIVVRSVVAGGAAARDARLAPGDRLVSVNGASVARSPLAVAVAAIKSAPKDVKTGLFAIYYDISFLPTFRSNCTDRGHGWTDNTPFSRDQLRQPFSTERLQVVRGRPGCFFQCACVL